MPELAMAMLELVLAMRHYGFGKDASAKFSLSQGKEVYSLLMAHLYERVAK